jgi:hypothetical protein
MDFGAAAQPALLLARRVERAIRILVDELNVRLMRKLGASRREFFDTIDRPALPLPAEPHQYAERRRTRVAPDYPVEVQGRFPGKARACEPIKNWRIHIGDLRILQATAIAKW